MLLVSEEHDRSEALTKAEAGIALSRVKDLFGDGMLD